MDSGCGWRRFALPSSRGGGSFELALAVELDKAAASELESIVILLHGRERDAVEILRQARPRFSDRRTLVVAPRFLNGLDKELVKELDRIAGRPTSSLLLWKGNEWGEGGPSRIPAGSNVSSFEALDALLAFHTSSATFPRVKRVLLVGHSLGGQLVQRYSLLGSGLDDPSQRRHIDVAYIVMNPSTYCYIDERRTFKYGLGQREAHLSHYPAAVQLSRAAVERRWSDRRVHYLHGEKDTGVGDDRPAAMEQGKDRLERSRRWRDHLNALGWPALHTFGYVPAVGHDAGKMMASTQFSHIIQSYQVG